MSEILALAVITVLSVIAPGAGFALIVRDGCLHDRRTGLLPSWRQRCRHALPGVTPLPGPSAGSTGPGR
jgi:hypothetical protein